MRNRSLRLAVASGAVVLLAQSVSGARAEQCSFFDAGTNQSLEGRCTVAYAGDAETITIGQKRVVFVQTARQGQWAVGTLDGKPAMRYEINRTAYSYATRDLTLFLDQSDE
jgi:hypothetical protein